jgi:hypothetical protein
MMHPDHKGKDGMKLKEQIAQQPPYRRASLAYRQAGRYQVTTDRNVPTVPPNYYSAQTEPLFLIEEKPRTHWRRYFIVGMLVVLAGITLWQMVVAPFLQGISDQWHYGDARVAVLYTNVGHQGSSTFMAFDDNGQVMVVEIPESAKVPAHIYHLASVTGTGRGHAIITLRVQDVNADGKPDLIVHVEGMQPDMVLFNNGTSFSWTSK